MQYPVIKDTCLPLPGRIGMHKEVWASDTAMQGRMSADKCEYAVTQPTPHHYGPMLGVNIQIKEATLGLCMLQIIIIFIGPTINHSLGLRYVRVQAETLTGLVLVPGSWGGGSPADQLVFLLDDTGRLDGASFGKAKEEA